LILLNAKEAVQKDSLLFFVESDAKKTNVPDMLNRTRRKALVIRRFIGQYQLKIPESLRLERVAELLQMRDIIVRFLKEKVSDDFSKRPGKE
jgi:hypothetical protein